MAEYPDPFRHWALDAATFPPAGGWEGVEAAVPPADWPGWVTYRNDLESGKRTCRDPGALPAPLWGVLAGLNSGEAARRLGQLAGIEGLTPDPSLHGAGLHVSGPGSWLAPHLDYSIHPSHPRAERRLSLILFCNPWWRPEWGGALLLCDPWGKAVRRIPPSPGRVVVFENGDGSYHGVEQTSPDAPDRVTLAAYFLAPARPGATRRRALFVPNRDAPHCPAECLRG